LGLDAWEGPGVREGRCAQFSVLIHEYENGRASVYSRTEYIVDITTVIHLAISGGGPTQGTDRNYIIPSSDACAGFAADADVVATRGEPECSPAEGVVIRTGYIIPECGGADCGVAATVHGVLQSNETGRCVIEACRVAKQGLVTGGGVLNAFGVVKKSKRSIGCVLGGDGVA
jgi:hypothetical protein